MRQPLCAAIYRHDTCTREPWTDDDFEYLRRHRLDGTVQQAIGFMRHRIHQTWWNRNRYIWNTLHLRSTDYGLNPYIMEDGLAGAANLSWLSGLAGLLLIGSAKPGPA